MYRTTQPTKTSLKVNQSYQGEFLEQKIRRIVNNKEPITDGAPLIYTERAKGVEPQYDIRTDRFDVAIDAMDVVAKTHQAKREERHKPKDNSKETSDKTDKGTNKNSGEATSVQATTGTTPNK